jgi:hypothetical protein
MLKPRALPSASLALGWKEYATPTEALVAGEPEIVGARLAVPETLIENACIAFTVWPSET